MKVLAGEWNGESSPLITGVPVLIMHVMMEAGSETKVDIPRSYQAGIYVLKGYGLFGEEAIDAEEGSLVLFNNGGETISMKAPASRPLEILLLSGEPIGEPIATYGPFVMNNIDEIYEAMVEYSSGQLGSITI
jgi:redox-sensitive bicupin YhaK (pirin superfamily)